MIRAAPALVIVVTAMAAAPVAAQAPLGIADARKAIAAERSRLWKDPDSIRDARITAPHQCPYRPPGSICVCVEANAKNSLGGYTGITKTRLYFSGSKIVDSIGPLGTAAPDQCGSFVPFNELNGRK